jgi:CxxC-x17-CxxC domain-containing protein
MYKAKCSICGKEIEVPYGPSEKRPAYCRNCFQKRFKDKEHSQKVQGSQNVKTNLTAQLSSVVSLIVPEHIESGSSAQITVLLKNNTQIEFTNLNVDLSDMMDDFEIEGEVRKNKLKRGMEVENYIVIKPKYPRGLFPVKIRITGNGVTVEKEYTIKVGGTEIY